jgi:tRNA modification GTPase
MFAPDDTIVAVATAAGRAAIGVVRISGDQATDVARSLLARRAALQPRIATFARLRTDGAERPEAGDEVVVTWFAAPHSYTGQHVVEISSHGSAVILEAIVRRAMAAGARLARPGEFTLRAFLAGKRDLIQAEAVADLVNAATPLQAQVAFDQLEGTLTRRITEVDARLFDVMARLEASLDFPDEGYHFIDRSGVATELNAIVAQLDDLLGDAGRGRMIREGATVVIAGRTNVGKSSLFNALIGSDRAIVTDVPGTTRDLITEITNIDGLLITLVDTAGSRVTHDVVEREGVSRGSRARQVADLCIVVRDGSMAETDEDRAVLDDTVDLPRVLVVNKSDLDQQRPVSDGHAQAVHVSARTGEGLDALRTAIVRALCGDRKPARETAAISNVRHVALLEDARRHLVAATEASGALAAPEEFVLSDLQAARACLDEVVGRRTSEDLLHYIFDRFCIGK